MSRHSLIAFGIARWLCCSFVAWKLSDGATAATLDSYGVGSGTSGASLTCMFPNSFAATAGDLLVASYTDDGAHAPGTPTGYSSAATSGSGVAQGAIFYKTAIGGETSVSSTYTTSSATCVFYDFSTLGSSTPRTAYTGTQVGGSTCTLSGGTSATAGDVGVGFLAAGATAGSQHPTSGSQTFLTQAISGGAEYADLSATGSAVPPNWTWTSTAAGACAAVFFSAPAPATTTTTAATTTTTGATTTTTTAPIAIDYSRFCAGVLAPVSTTSNTGSTTSSSDTTTTVGCNVSISGFVGDGNAIPVALGMLFLAIMVCIPLLIVRRHRA